MLCALSARDRSTLHGNRSSRTRCGWMMCCCFSVLGPIIGIGAANGSLRPGAPRPDAAATGVREHHKSRLLYVCSVDVTSEPGRNLGMRQKRQVRCRQGRAKIASTAEIAPLVCTTHAMAETDPVLSIERTKPAPVTTANCACRVYR